MARQKSKPTNLTRGKPKPVPEEPVKAGEIWKTLPTNLNLQWGMRGQLLSGATRRDNVTYRAVYEYEDFDFADEDNREKKQPPSGARIFKSLTEDPEPAEDEDEERKKGRKIKKSTRGWTPIRTGFQEGHPPYGFPRDVHARLYAIWKHLRQFRTDIADEGYEELSGLIENLTETQDYLYALIDRRPPSPDAPDSPATDLTPGATGGESDDDDDDEGDAATAVTKTGGKLPRSSSNKNTVPSKQDAPSKKRKAANTVDLDGDMDRPRKGNTRPRQLTMEERDAEIRAAAAGDEDL